jgi:hypothetical protein
MPSIVSSGLGGGLRLRNNGRRELRFDRFDFLHRLGIGCQLFHAMELIADA